MIVLHRGLWCSISKLDMIDEETARRHYPVNVPKMFLVVIDNVRKSHVVAMVCATYKSCAHYLCRVC